MALNASTLASAMKNAVDALSDKTDRNAIFLALATEIVNHIKNNAQVVVASVTGVTPGGGVSGTGTGTIL
jgi:hypothetical protein